MNEQSGAQFEIVVDGKPRSYRDIRAVAIASAEYLKSLHPQSEVAVKDRSAERDRDRGHLQAAQGRMTMEEAQIAGLHVARSDDGRRSRCARRLALAIFRRRQHRLCAPVPPDPRCLSALNGKTPQSAAFYFCG
jgi:hypothetical protein